MTALSSFRSRGEVGLRKYKDFVFLIALLCLLCPASSWISEKELQTMKENIRNLQEDAAMRKLDNKVDAALLTLLLEEAAHATDLVTELLKSPLPTFQFPIEQLKDLKRYLVDSQDVMQKKFQNEAKQVKQYEDKLVRLETFVAKLAEEHDEL